MSYSGPLECYNVLYALKINFIINTKCNFNCSYCAQSKFKQLHIEVTKKQYDIFLNNLYNTFFHYKYIDLCFNGREPFLHPDIKYFITSIIDMFPQLHKICLLTNGCNNNIFQILSSLDEKYLKKILLVIAFHSEQTSLENFIQYCKQYYMLPIMKSSIRLSLDLQNENDYDIKENMKNILQNHFPDWSVIYKLIYKVIGYGKNYYFSKTNNIYLILKQTHKMIYVNDILYSPQEIIYHELNNFNRYVCKPQLFINPDGSYTDRICQQKNIQNNIFIVNHKINIKDSICYQHQCIHECDFQTAKYDLKDYGTLLKKQSR